MRYFFLCFTFLMLLAFTGQSQQKYLRFVEKKKYEKLQEEVTESLAENSRDFDANIGATLLYYKDDSPAFDMKKAFYYNTFAKELFQEILDPKRLGKLNDLQINLGYFDVLQDSIYYKSYNQLVASPTVMACNEYLGYFTGLPKAYSNDVVRLRNKLAFDAAVMTNSVESFQEFIDSYPQALQIQDAIKRRDGVAFALVKNTKDIQLIQGFITKYPNSELRFGAIEIRDRWAYDQAVALNTVAGFQDFLTKYPTSGLANQVIELRDNRAFETTTDDVAGWKNYIANYPSSKRLNEAQSKLYALAWDIAKRENSLESYAFFTSEYPNSLFVSLANEAMTKLKYDRLIKTFSQLEAIEFLSSNPANTMTFAVADTMIKRAFQARDISLLDEPIAQTRGEIQNRLLAANYYWMTLDGELITLNMYFDEGTESDESDEADDDLDENESTTSENEEEETQSYIPPKEKDYEVARMGDALNLNAGFQPNMLGQYETYLRAAKGKERSFVAIQKMIKDDIDKKNWPNAIAKVDKYTKLILAEGSYLDSISPTIAKLKDLRAILAKPVDVSIVPKNWGAPVNSAIGAEYAPTLSADDKMLYFIGRNRINSLPSDSNDEDIFVSRFIGNQWSNPSVMKDLSNPNSNEGVQHVSSDGTKLVLFVNGKLTTANKGIAGWDVPQELDEINADDWQADANFTSDNNALLFASTRSTNYNFVQSQMNIGAQRSLSYHGETGESADIYVSLKDANGNWGEAINLGPTINTDFNDRSPFLHPDMKTLYFSSSGHGGLGSMDVFKSTRLSDTCWTCWSKPENLGKEINTSETESGYKISTSGEMAYFAYEKKSNTESSILFLLDVSGSMDGDKLEALKKATLDACKSAINKNAEVAILTFGNTCQGPIVNVFPFTKDLSNLDQFVENLYVTGGTPMYEAYLVGSDFMQRYASKRSSNKVITLMTDGDANGCTTLDAVIKKIKSRKILFKTQAIAFDVAEYSNAYNDLKKISSISKGKFYHANGSDDLGSKFETASNDIFNLTSGGTSKDIYSLKLPPSMRPDFVATIKGKLTDSQNKIVDAQIKWEDLELNKPIGVSNVDPETGEYFIILPMGKLYGYYVDKNGYFPIANNLDLRKYNKPINITNDIKMVTIDEMKKQGVSVIANNLFFETNKSDLLPYSIPELERVAKIIKSTNQKIQIAGHTDDVGNVPANQLLSVKRAESVMKYLISLGCDPARISATGFGKSMPIADNKTEAGRALNRRVEVKFITL